MLEENNPSTGSGQRPEMPLKTQADLLGISYSSLFYEPAPPSARELAIKRRIDEIYTACPFYGSRKIAVQLRPEFGVSRPTVQAYTASGHRLRFCTLGIFQNLTAKPAKYAKKMLFLCALCVLGGKLKAQFMPVFSIYARNGHFCPGSRSAYE